MRKRSEKKTHTTSLRMTEEQYSTLERHANENKISMSCYILNSALHADNKLTPAIMVEIQQLVNHAYEAVKLNVPEQAISLQKEAAALWCKLK